MSENERKFTTTISTIAIQSGKTRIVIALLQSGNLMELKMVELVPELTVLGESFEEASELENAHLHVLQQLQNKQSPVEELLKKADQVIADQKPQAEVYAAMADSLGQAWNDINSYLLMRKHILHLNVTYHSKAEACVERMRVLELLCLSPMPSNEETLKESLDCMQEVKKSMLECLMGALKAGQSLLAALNELATKGAIDSRTRLTKRAAQSAIAVVEKWMEDLHNRRRLLDVTWQRRKHNLEKCRTLSILKCDLEILETLLKERHKSLVRCKDVLGDSAAAAEDLLRQHLQFLPEAKNLQEEGVHMVKASERLPSSSHKFSDQSNKISYNVLNLANEYVQAMNDREVLLRKSICFFNTAKSVILKLEEMNYQLKNVNSTSERLIIMNMTEEIIKDVIKDGYSILEHAPEANGIKRILSEIENTKLSIMTYCIKENDQIFEVSQIVNNFYEKHNLILSWLITAIETVLQKHQDLGGGLQSAQNFFYLHKKLLNDMKFRSADIAEMVEFVPYQVRERLQPNTKDDIDKKVETIAQHFNSLKAIVEERLSVASKYVEFHSLAVALESELDSFARSLGAIDSEKVLKYVEPASLKIKQLHSQLVVAAEDFIDELPQTRDSYLDAKRAQLCVETVLEHFANRKSDIEEKWNIWERSALDKETSQALWIKNMVDSENTIDWVVKLESQLYPVLNTETTDADTQAQQVEHKLNHIIPEIKRAQQEIQLRIKTAKELIVGGALENDVEVPPKLHELHDSVCNIIVEYTIFLEIFATFLKTIKELDRKIIDLKKMSESVNDLHQQQVNDVRVKHIAASKAFYDLWNIGSNEGERLIEKIKIQEPAKYAEKDMKAVSSLVENKKLEWDSLSATVEQSLDRLQMAKQFDQDLDAINTNIKDLANELKTLQNQYGLSLSAAKSSLFAFQSFEKNFQLTEEKIKTFLSLADETLKVNESKSEEIEQQVCQLKEQWNKFCVRVSETKHLIDLSIQYFTLIGETEECFREGTKLLVCVARKSSTARTAQEADQLSKDIKLFLNSVETKQEQRIRSLSDLVTQLFDDEEHKRQVSQIEAENQDMLESFSSVSKELSSLQSKLVANPIEEVPIEVVHVKKERETLTIEEVTSPSTSVEEVEEDDEEDEAPIVEEIVEVEETSAGSCPPLKKSKFSEESTVPLQAPVFVSPLSDAEVQEGSKFVFECKVEGNPAPTISWLKEGLSIGNNPDYHTTFDSGVCILRIEEVFAEDSAKFVCRATNEAGVAETAGVLMIIEKDADELQPPVFTVPLKDISVNEKDAAELYCKVNGNPLPVVQWSRDNVSVDSNPFYEITFNNGDAKLVIKNASLEDNAAFSCIATNPLKSLASSCRVKVLGQSSSAKLPAFSTRLSNVMVRAGQKLKLNCSVTGEPTPSLTWYHNGKVLKELPNIVTSVDESGNVVLVVLEAFPKDAGEYTLVAWNSAGETSCSCNVSVKGLLPCETSDSEIPSDIEPIRPSISSPLSDVVTQEGSEAILECVIVGQPEPEVIWYHDDVPVKEGDKIQLYFKGDKCSLHIKEVCREDAGIYKVVAINSAGDISSTCQVTVSASTEITNMVTSVEESESTVPKFEKLLSDVLIREGDTVVLECSISGNPEPEVKWYLNSSELKFDDRVKFQKCKDGVITLTVQNVTPQDKGLYTIRASNSLGEAKCFSHVIVKSLSSAETKSSDVHLEDKFERPAFVEFFCDQRVRQGGPAKFECIVVGKPAPKVRWLINNEPVCGKAYLVSTSGDRQVLSIPEVGAENIGVVTCAAKNDVGEAFCEAYLSLVDSASLDNPTMNVFESSNAYEVKKSTVSKSVAFNNEAPVSNTDSYTSMMEQSSQKVNDGQPIKTESRHIEQQHETNGRLSDYSSQSFSSGAADLQNHFQYSKQNGVSSLKPARKQTAPRFISPLNGAIADPGRDVRFEAAVESYPPANIVWYKNNSELSNEANKTRITWELNRASLEIYKVNAADAGRYTCSASNDAGIASSSADLIVKKTAFPPVMGKRLHPQSVALGKRVMFEIEVTGTPTPTVSWYKDELQLARTSPFYRLREQGHSHALIIEEARFEDSGQYKVKAHNEAGEAASLATLNVFEPPPSIADNCKFSQHSVIENKSFGNPSLPPYNDFSNNMQISNLNSSAPDSNFSKTVEVTKTNKHVAFLNGQKVQDDFNVSSETYQARDKDQNIRPYTPSKNNFVENQNYSSNYDNTFNNYTTSDSKEIEMLQKPLVYSDMDSFPSYATYDKSNNNEFILEPGPPPEMGYIPKVAVAKHREPMAERVKKLESSQRQLSPVEIPPGAVKIFPTIIPKRKETENVYQKKYSSCVKEYKNSLQRSASLDRDYDSHREHVQETPNLRVSEIERMKREADTLNPIYRPHADFNVRPLSPRPSAEGVSMEKMWSQKKTLEDQSYMRPVTPRGFPPEETSSAFRQTDFKRSQSPLPSAEGVAMDKLWAHPRSRPHSVIGMDGLNTTTETSFKSKKVESTTWASGSGPAKTDTKVAYEDMCKVNDKVVSRNKFEDSYSNYDNRDFQRSVSEDRGKRTNKKFKWPPEEVSIQDSLVRKTPEIACTVNPSGVRRNVEEQQRYSYGGVHSMPLANSRTVHEKHDSFVSNQTLPRSFKFASSNDSKFKPVKAFASDKFGRRNSDYESDFEVTKISKEACWKPSSPAQQSISSSSFSKELVTNLASEKKFAQSGGSMFAKPAGDSGYQADVEESHRPGYVPVPKHSSISFPQAKTHTLPRLSENKSSHVFTDDTKIKTSVKKPYAFAPAVPSPARFTKSDYRESDTYESDHDARIPPIWRPSDAEHSQRSYRPVRPNLTPTQRPFYNRSASTEMTSNEYTYSNQSKSNFQPVSPVIEYSSGVKVKPSASFSGGQRSMFNDRQCNRSVTNEGDTIRYRNEMSQSQVRPKPGGYEGNYEEHYTTSETTNHGTKFSEVKKVQKVEEIRKRFESNSGGSCNESAMMSCDDGVDYGSFGRSRIPDEFVTPRQNGQTMMQQSSYKSKSQQIIDNIVHNVNSKQNELKQGAMKSPSLYSPSVLNEAQVFKEHYRNNEHGVERLDWRKKMVFFKYKYGFVDSKNPPVMHECFATFPRTQSTSSCSSIFKPPKISNVSFAKWSPKRRRVVFENRIDVKSFSPDSQHATDDDEAAVGDSSWPELTRSASSDYVIVNGGHGGENEGPQTAPVFSTPLHDIAAVVGSKARFECIVQSDSPFNVEWRKDGMVVRDSDLHEISLRNGVCKLTLLKTYMYDAGTYECIAVNRGGVAETSATLTVSGERRSFIKK